MFLTVCLADHSWGLLLNPFSPCSRTGAKTSHKSTVSISAAFEDWLWHAVLTVHPRELKSNCWLKPKPLVSCVKWQHPTETQEIWTNSEEEGSLEEMKRICQNTQAQNGMKNSRTQQPGARKGRRMLWYLKKVIVTQPTPAKIKSLKPVKILSFLLLKKQKSKPQYYEVRKVLRNRTNQRETAKSKVLRARKRKQFRVKSQRHLSREDGWISPLGIKFKARDFKLPRSVIPEMESL